MELQSVPVGQQITDALLLNGIHTLLEGQQKLDGRPSWEQA